MSEYINDCHPYRPDIRGAGDRIAKHHFQGSDEDWGVEHRLLRCCIGGLHERRFTKVRDQDFTIRRNRIARSKYARGLYLVFWNVRSDRGAIISCDK